MERVIIGLGNHGDEYKNTRHNVGWVFLDFLAGDVVWEKVPHHRALEATANINGEQILLVKPQTFMNNSGEAVRGLMKDGYTPSDMIIVHDEVDLPLGAYKIESGRGSAGHHGVESVLDALGTNAVTRIRLGISPVSFFGHMKKPKGADAVSRFVLGVMSTRERGKVATHFPEIKENLTI